MLLLGLLLLLSVVHSIETLGPKRQFKYIVDCSRQGVNLVLKSSVDQRPVTLSHELLRQAWDLAGVAECLQLGREPVVFFTCSYIANSYRDRFYWGAHPNLHHFSLTLTSSNFPHPKSLVVSIYSYENFHRWSGKIAGGYAFGLLGEFKRGWPRLPPGLLESKLNYRLVMLGFLKMPHDFLFVWREYDEDTKQEWMLGMRDRLSYENQRTLRRKL